MAKETERYNISLPDELNKEIEKIINNNSKWKSKYDFVKDAIEQQLINYKGIELDEQKKDKLP